MTRREGAGFEKVLIAGHSLGSAISILEAATYHDVDGVVITGLAHRIDGATTRGGRRRARIQPTRLSTNRA